MVSLCGSGGVGGVGAARTRQSAARRVLPAQREFLRRGTLRRTSDLRSTSHDTRGRSRRWARNTACGEARDSKQGRGGSDTARRGTSRISFARAGRELSTSKTRRRLVRTCQLPLELNDRWTSCRRTRRRSTHQQRVPKIEHTVPRIIQARRGTVIPTSYLRPRQSKDPRSRNGRDV